MWPPLTTMKQPVDTIGEAAAAMLLQLLSEPHGGSLETTIETHLVARESVAAPPVTERQVA